MNSTPSGKWSLSRGAFEQLLAALGPDRQAAARQYETVRRRLIHFFDWQGSPTPDVEADVTLDRVARKLQDGEVVENVNAYARGVARHVLMERQRRAAQERAALEVVSREPATIAPPDADEGHMACLRACLAELSKESRELIVAYYRGEGRVHLEGRKKLAEQLGLTYAALKKRAFRLRESLHACLVRCIEGKVG